MPNSRAEGSPLVGCL